MYPKWAKAIRDVGSTSSSLTIRVSDEFPRDRPFCVRGGVGGFDDFKAVVRLAAQTPDLGVLLPLGWGDGGLSKNL